jgi:predicted dehydrogenase
VSNGSSPDQIQVGVIGVNPSRGWATAAHLPALSVLPDFRTVAVASTRAEGAEAVAAQFRVPHAFDNPFDLIACPEVDVVAISVKVPDHAPLIRAAIDAGKHIYCEWPLGIDDTEARELTRLAEAKGIHHLVGLQAYVSSGARFVEQLVQQGLLGKVNAASLVVLTPSIGGTEVAQALAYTADRTTGTNLMTTSAGHALAALSRTVGDVADISAVVETLHSEVRVVETGERIPNDAPNEVAAIGLLTTGAVVSLAVHGGTPISAPRFSFRIIGTEGALLVRPTTLGDSINVGDWKVTLARPDGSAEELPVPAETNELPPSGPAKNVARMYDELGSAMRAGRRAVPDFRMALKFHEVVAAIQLSADIGRRIHVQAADHR